MSFRVISSLRWVWWHSRDHAALLPSFNAFLELKSDFFVRKRVSSFPCLSMLFTLANMEKLLLVCEFFVGSVVLLQAKV